MEKLNTDSIRMIAEFEKITKTNVKDTYEHQERIVIVVGEGEAKRAVGPSGKTLQLVESKLGKRFKIVEYHPEVLTFVQHVMLPLKASKIEWTGEGEITVWGPDEKTRGLMIGARAQNLRFFERVVQKYFPDVKEIKVTG